MPRPNRLPEQRRELVPVLAQTFADLGYRRTTTAALAGACGVRENILYRLWPDKRRMFVAALDHVYEESERVWSGLLEDELDGVTAAERILLFESEHHGEHGLYRIVFAGLSETDDPEVAAALKRLYGRFQRFVERQVRDHFTEREVEAEARSVSWAILGLGTVASIGRELGLLSRPARKRLLAGIGGELLRSRLGGR